MAAKKKKRNESPAIAPWLAVVLGLAIAAFAAFALLSDGRIGSNSPIPDVSDTSQADVQHDRDQIDQASRDQLRDILRAEDNGE
ncbi:MAG: hypothetical protein GY944_08065 [bacterium]|nr:hypothetical protein [bacterium]